MGNSALNLGSFPPGIAGTNTLAINTPLINMDFTNPVQMRPDPLHSVPTEIKDRVKTEPVALDKPPKSTEEAVTPIPVTVVYEGETVPLPFLSGTSLEENDKLYCTFKRHSVGVHPAERKLPYCYPIVVYSCKDHGRHVDERLRAAFNSNKVRKKKEKGQLFG